MSDLPLLTAMMRERGLPVAGCKLTPHRYKRGYDVQSVVVT